MLICIPRWGPYPRFKWFPQLITQDRQVKLQGSLLSLAGAAASIIFVAMKVLCDKRRLLSRQKYACHDKTFVVTNIFLLWQNFCPNKYLSQQQFCVTKALSWQAYFCCDKSMLVATKLLLWLFKNFCCDSLMVFLNCHDQISVVASILLSRQKTCTCLSWQKFCCDSFGFFKLSRPNFCCGKHTFVTTKDLYVFVMTKVLLWQFWVFKLSRPNFCCGKHTFVTTKDVYVFVVTKVLLWQFWFF